MLRRKSVVVFCILIVALVLVGCQVPLTGESVVEKNAIRETAVEESEKLGRSRLKEFGLIAQEGDWTYYCNVSDEYKLYKVKKDGTKNTKLNDDESWAINIIEDWIYYENGSDGFKLYRIRKDGTQRTKVGIEQD